MKKNIILVAILALIVTGCAGNTSKKVAVMQRKDKNLNCKEVLLEMNEASFYSELAERNKGPNFKNIVKPLGYFSTYMSSEEAIDSSQARVKYLEKIYDILQCEKWEEARNAAPVNNVIASDATQAPYRPVGYQPYGYYY